MQYLLPLLRRHQCSWQLPLAFDARHKLPQRWTRNGCSDTLGMDWDDQSALWCALSALVGSIIATPVVAVVMFYASKKVLSAATSHYRSGIMRDIEEHIYNHFFKPSEKRKLCSTCCFRNQDDVLYKLNNDGSLRSAWYEHVLFT